MMGGDVGISLLHFSKGALYLYSTVRKKAWCLDSYFTSFCSIDSQGAQQSKEKKFSQPIKRLVVKRHKAVSFEVN